jgi:hypothetical protein
MSTLSDPDYTLQLIRLQCLRRLADPLLPAILTFPETFSPHVIHSDLVDASIWPELSIVRPPEPVAAPRSGHKNGLKYSETIVGDKGPRMGAGMRVTARQRQRPEWLKEKRASMARAECVSTHVLATGHAHGCLQHRRGRARTKDTFFAYHKPHRSSKRRQPRHASARYHRIARPNARTHSISFWKA